MFRALGSFLKSRKASTPQAKRVADKLERGVISEAKEALHKKKASATLIPLQSSVKFPSLQGVHNLKKQIVSVPEVFRDAQVKSNTKATLVIGSTKRVMVLKQTAFWRNTFKESFPLVPVFDLVVTDNPAYKALKWIIERAEKNHEDPSIHDTILHAYSVYGSERFNDLYGTLDLSNDFLTYAYLLDHRMMIRWKAVGPPSDDDAAKLVDVTNQLLSESVMKDIYVQPKKNKLEN